MEPKLVSLILYVLEFWFVGLVLCGSVLMLNSLIGGVFLRAFSRYTVRRVD